MKFIIHYGELFLKRRNRSMFERALERRIKSLLPNCFLLRTRGRMFIECGINRSFVVSALKKVFGISWFGEVVEFERGDLEGAFSFLESSLPERFRLTVKRPDKSFPLTSQDVFLSAVERLRASGKAHSKSGVRARIELSDKIYVVSKEERGLGGLPIGASGRLLSLLSGGVDSAVASWMMMKRGCFLDFVHFSASGSGEPKKILNVRKKLEEYGNNGKMFVIPYDLFYSRTMGVDQRVELVLFRKFMFECAERICKIRGIPGMVSGDSLGQVASQTLENLLSASPEFPVYRPLIAFDKEETLSVAERIGIRKICEEPYKDCCSLVASKHPKTKTDRREIQHIWNEFGLDEAVERSIKGLVLS